MYTTGPFRDTSVAITDLTDMAGNPVSQVTFMADGVLRYYSPDGDTSTHWLDVGQGLRIAVRPVSIVGPAGPAGPVGPAGPSGTTNSVDPASYGAVGDGVTDDTAAIQQALTTGKNVALQSGLSYLVMGNLRMAAGQVLYGNGATIKRGAQITRTTAANVATGATSIQVTDATGLQVGMYVCVEDGGTLSTGAPVPITSIVGTTVNVGASVSVLKRSDSTAGGPILSGANLRTCGYLVHMAEGCTVRDLVVDGNGSNIPYSWWRLSTEVVAGASYGTIDNVRVVNARAEGIGLYLTSGSGVSVGQQVRNCAVLNVGGNGIHMSSTTGALIDGCRLINCNQDSTLGHRTGSVCWSLRNSWPTVTNNYIEGGYAGFGEIAGSCVISGNTVVGAAKAFWAHAQRAPGGEAAENFLITNNHFVDCSEASFNSSSGDGYLSRVTISDNVFDDTPLSLSWCEDLTVSGNTLRNVTTASGTVASLTLSRVSRARISGNVIRDAYYAGINLAGTSNVDVCLSGNQVAGGCTVYGLALISTGLTVSGNIIDTVTGIGINVLSGATRILVADNEVNAAGNIGIYVVPADAAITGNRVQGCGAEGIRVAASSQITGNTCVNNTGSGIRLAGTDSQHVITGNRSTDTRAVGAKTQTYGINIPSTATLTAVVAGNLCEGNATASYSMPAGATVTKSPDKKLSATVGATQTSVAHGLGYIPRVVQIVPTSAGQVWQSASADITNIYLTADGAGRTADVWVG